MICPAPLFPSSAPILCGYTDFLSKNKQLTFTHKQIHSIFEFTQNIFNAIYVPANFTFSLSFNCCIRLHCANLSHFLYPFIHCWTSNLFLISAFCEESINEHSWAICKVFPPFDIFFNIFSVWMFVCVYALFFYYMSFTCLIKVTPQIFCVSRPLWKALLYWLLSQFICHLFIGGQLIFCIIILYPVILLKVFISYRHFLV